MLLTSHHPHLRHEYNCPDFALDKDPANLFAVIFVLGYGFLATLTELFVYMFSFRNNRNQIKV